MADPLAVPARGEIELRRVLALPGGQHLYVEMDSNGRLSVWWGRRVDGVYAAASAYELLQAAALRLYELGESC